MKYEEKKMDLFECNKKYNLVHCIAADARMGAGIAVQFTKKYPQIKLLRSHTDRNKVGTCVRVGKILNLITKAKSTGKPTYSTLESSLQDCKSFCLVNKIKYLAMPKIGCGLDGLQWFIVSDLIQRIFEDMEIEILVCIKF